MLTDGICCKCLSVWLQYRFKQIYFWTYMINRIGVLTSGGDAPGMNAAVRSVVRAAINEGISVSGIRDGFLGMHQDRIVDLDRADVNDIITRGGTFLGTARFTAFKEESVRREAIENLNKRNIDALVLIGGDGTYTGALRLHEMGIRCIGVPATIDNDVHGTEFSIGFDTAVNNIMQNMDRLRDTSSSHHRVTIVEVMGRHCGDLAMVGGIAGGADYIIAPELEFKKEDLFTKISQAFAAGKRHALICLCENMVNADALASELEATTGIECRATVLGHIQRGGSPTAYDRVLASRLGDYAVRLLIDGVYGKCVGVEGGILIATDFATAIETPKLSRIREYNCLSNKIS